MTLTVGSLFAGIGGFDLAARWMGWRTIWVSEIDPYCNRILAREWPDAPNLGDITRIDWSHVERPDILCGGFPCQPHSLAGKRKGSDDHRDLWGEFARAIRDLRPRYIVAENVPGLLTSDRGRFFNRVLSDLAALGYDAEWQVLSAADVGAPHRRERVWIVAAADRGRCEQRDSGQRELPEPDPTSPDVSNAVSPRLAERILLPGILSGARGADQGQVAPLGGSFPDPTGERLQARGEIRSQSQAAGSPSQRADQGRIGDWWLTEPDVGRVAHGVPARVDRLRSLGNAIVPQCAAVIFQRILELEAA